MSIPARLAELIDPEATRAKLARCGLDVRHADADYVRYKPDDTTIIGYLLTTPHGSRERGYIRWCTDIAEADHIAAKAATFSMTTSSLGAATTRLDDHSIFYPFPNDARLRRMRWHTTPRKWKRTLEPLFPRPMQLSGSRSSADILRYKPERRVVVAAHVATTNCDRRSVLIRYSTSNHAPLLAAIATSLRRGGIDTPRPLMQLDGGRVGVDEFIEADDLLTAVDAGHAPAPDVARAIGGFHAAPVDAPRRLAVHDLAQARSGLAGLARWCTSTQRLTDVLARRLARSMPTGTGPDVLLHGDLHGRNIMLRPDGRVTFVDLERVARGTAAIDLGQLRSAGIAAGLRHPERSPNAAAFCELVLEDHRRHQSHPTSERDIAWHTAVALTDQALLAARHLETDWQNSVDTLLELALGELSGLPVV